ncbi:TolC family protein [Paracidovorax wautersii]|uniref:Outer membrane protein, cobalt-zinc-cadmium efflux system n=1 Tax=Paracidovorax wautersii TaxID=1177982 RepID=A0A1I2B4A4_9BURK|nr:TolC family protein [Paracidovorax wautersii]SFE51005.1 outer membrane protein, cobalt-zinc-cadmium efflux system [Paracidovorax wautersii]
MLDPRPFLGKAGPYLLASLSIALTTLATGLAPVHAQTAATPPPPAATAAVPLTLAEAIALALAKNTGIAIAQREFDAAGGAALQAGLRPNPELSLQQEDFRRGRQTSTLQITQKLELGGKRAARTAVAERVREQAAADLEQVRADVRAQVVVAFHETLVAEERLRLARSSLELASGDAEATGKRVQAGKIAPIEQTRAQVARAAAQAEAAQAEGQLRTSRQKLFALWGDTSRSATPLLGRLDLPAEGLADGAVSARLAASPVLRRARLELDRARAAVELERSRRMVDVAVSVGAKRSQESGVTAAVVGLSVPLPLFDRNQGNIAEALSREDKAREELTAAELRLDSEIAQVREQLRSARAEALTLQRDAVPGALEAYRAAAQGFQLGKFSYLEALDAQRTWVTTQAQYLRALLDTYRAAAELERLLSIADAASPLLPPSQPQTP